MKKLIALLLLVASSAFAQTYEGSAPRTWVIGPVDKLARAYAGVTASGDYPWDQYHIVGGSWVPRPTVLAVRLILKDGFIYGQLAGGACFMLDPTGAPSPTSCPPITPPVTPPPVTPPPVTPPPVTPPPIASCDLSKVEKTITVTAVPTAYQQFAPGTASQASMDAYTKTIPRINQATIQAILQPVSDWWLRVSYCRQKLVFNVLPAVTLPGNPGCDSTRVWTDASKAAAGTKYDLLLAISPYGCWKGQGVGGYGGFIAWNTASDGAGMYGHELMHGLGLYHNASKLNGTIVEYGSGFDQVGQGSDFYTLRNIGGYHKQRLGMLTPMACASATLRPLADYPDTIQCGSWYLYQPEAWRGEIVVSKAEFTSGPFGGGGDVTDYKYLKAGQSYKMDNGKTVTHVGAGKVTIQ